MLTFTDEYDERDVDLGLALSDYKSVLYRKVEKAKPKIKKHTPKKSYCDAISR